MVNPLGSRHPRPVDLASPSCALMARSRPGWLPNLALAIQRSAIAAPKVPSRAGAWPAYPRPRASRFPRLPASPGFPLPPGALRAASATSMIDLILRLGKEPGRSRAKQAKCPLTDP